MKLAGQTTCLNSPKMIFGFEITNVLIDVTILIPPVFMVQRLQLHPAKRASLSIIFLLGLLWVSIYLIASILGGVRTS